MRSVLFRFERLKTRFFLKSKDNSGNIIEEFFIRGAASSQPLGLKDTMDYIKSHWKK